MLLDFPLAKTKGGTSKLLSAVIVVVGFGFFTVMPSTEGELNDD